jgi:phosphoribosylformylglycinamidine synthase
VVSHGICPKFSGFDAYHMAACAIDEAVRNNIASGGSLERMALLDNFCWCDPVASERNPDGEYKLAQLVRTNMALYDYTVRFGTPLISGKDSMKNDYVNGDLRISIPPTLLVSAISKMKDVRSAVTIDFKDAGDLVVVVGKTHAELAGSEYFSHLGLSGNIPPKVDGKLALKTYRALEKAIKAGIIRSAHDISDGGMGVTVAESAFAGGVGAEIDLSLVPQAGVFRDDYLLFSESQSRFILTVREGDAERLRKLFQSLPFAFIGKVTGEQRLKVRGIYGTAIIDVAMERLKEAWLTPFQNIFG